MMSRFISIYKKDTNTTLLLSRMYLSALDYSEAEDDKIVDVVIEPNCTTVVELTTELNPIVDLLTLTTKMAEPLIL